MAHPMQIEYPERRKGVAGRRQGPVEHAIKRKQSLKHIINGEVEMTAGFHAFESDAELLHNAVPSQFDVVWSTVTVHDDPLPIAGSELPAPFPVGGEDQLRFTPGEHAVVIWVNPGLELWRVV